MSSLAPGKRQVQTVQHSMRPLSCTATLAPVVNGDGMQFPFATKNEAPSNVTCGQIEIEIGIAQLRRRVVTSIGRTRGQYLTQAHRPTAFVHGVGVAMRFGRHDQH